MEQYYPRVVDPLGIDCHTFSLTFREISLAAHEHGLEATFTRQSWVQLAKLVQMTFQHDSYTTHLQDVVPRQFNISYIRWVYCILLWKDLFPGHPLPWYFARTTEHDRRRLQRQFVCRDALLQTLSQRDANIISWSINTAYYTVPESDTGVENAGMRYGLAGILRHAVSNLVKCVRSFTRKAQRRINQLLDKRLLHRHQIEAPLWYEEHHDDAWESISLSEDGRYARPCDWQGIGGRHRSFSCSALRFENPEL